MSDHHKPSAGFSITVALVAVLAGYPLSVGPAYWLHRQDWAYSATHRAFHAVYDPIIWIYLHGPTAAHDAIRWYLDLWL